MLRYKFGYLTQGCMGKDDVCWQAPHANKPKRQCNLGTGDLLINQLDNDETKVGNADSTTWYIGALIEGDALHESEWKWQMISRLWTIT